MSAAQGRSQASSHRNAEHEGHAADGRIPVTLLTGFLGSGKTTVLNRLLSQPELGDTAVIINEFGEIGLDHLLVEQVSENLRILNSGCLCCTVRGDLVDTLGDLAARRVRGEIPAFRRAIIETTGLADPAPVLHTLMADPAIFAGYRLDGVVTTVDAVNGGPTLDRHLEAVKQVAVADRLLLTKCDLAAGSARDALALRLRELNPGARLLQVADGAVAPGDVLGTGWYDPLQRPAEVQAWLAGEAQHGTAGQHRHHGHGHEHAHGHGHGHGHGHHHPDVNRHDAHIRAYGFTLAQPVQASAFAHWLDLMAAMRGEKLLRVKGLVHLAGEPDAPLVVHGVQHVFHPPRRLAGWPSADHRTRLVFITHDLDPADIVRTLQTYTGAQPVTPLAFS